jgi:hypothetical protein
MRHVRLTLMLGLLSACTENPSIPKPDDTNVVPGDKPRGSAPRDSEDAPPAAEEDRGEDLQRSLHSSLQWKRYATFENDLAAALELDPKELCNEFGTEPCVRGVHLSPLGGHDIATGLLESPPEPLVTTPTAVERIVLSACLARVAKESEQATEVFGGVSMAEPAPAPASEEAHELVRSLTRRFLARDPSEAEGDVLSALALEPGGKARPAATFATLVCLALGSATEFLFF